MNKIFIRFFFIFSILWGVGYPFPFRYPLYIFISPLIIITSSKFKNIRFYNLKNEIFYLINKLIFSNQVLFLIPIIIYLFLWEISSFLYLFYLIVFVLVLRNFIKYQEIEEKEWIYKSLIISIVLVGLSLPFVGSFHANVPASNGLYPEPSHLGFTLGPLLGILTRRKQYRLIGIVGLLFFGIFSYSKSLLLSYVFSLTISKRFSFKFKPSNIALSILAFTTIIILVKAYILFILENLNDYYIDYGVFGSSIIWFYWLKQSFLEFLKIPFGVGPFGWLHYGSEFPLLIPECNYEVICIYYGKFITSLNQRDLASLLSYGIASFGYLFPLYLFLLLNRICQNVIKISENYYQLDPISILLISYILIYMFRWSGFTAGPFLGLLCFMPKQKSKVCNKFLMKD